MNEYDRNNFDFMMQLSAKEFEEFFADMPADDINYAIDLIKQARSELVIQELELMDAEESDMTQARLVLARIMAK